MPTAKRQFCIHYAPECQDLCLHRDLTLRRIMYRTAVVSMALPNRILSCTVRYKDGEIRAEMPECQDLCLGTVSGHSAAYCNGRRQSCHIALPRCLLSSRLSVKIVNLESSSRVKTCTLVDWRVTGTAVYNATAVVSIALPTIWSGESSAGIHFHIAESRQIAAKQIAFCLHVLA